MLVYRFDVLAKLKELGYSLKQMRDEKLLNESAIQALRHDELVGMKVLDNLCNLLDCQPGDIIEYKRMTVRPQVFGMSGMALTIPSYKNESKTISYDSAIARAPLREEKIAKEESIDYIQQYKERMKNIKDKKYSGSISYDPLWKRMKEIGVRNTDLREIISPTTLNRMKSNQNVAVDTIMTLCDILQCQPGDIVKYEPQPEITQLKFDFDKE